MSPSVSRRTFVTASLATGAAVAVGSEASPALAAPPAEVRSGPRIAVIGSGYGGAVAARSLAEAGRRVDLIEMGADWEAMSSSSGRVFPGMRSPNERSMWFMNRTDMPFSYLGGLDIINRPIRRAAGVLDIETFAGIKVYLGRGVGGGSLVNGGMAVTPSRSFFEKVLPSVDAAEMYDIFFPRARQQLLVTEPPLDIVMNSPWYQFARVSALQARKVGYQHQLVPNVYDFDYLRKETFKQVPRSALVGEVMFGNNYGKRSLPKSILRTALATNRVNLIRMTEVTQLSQRPDGTFELSLRTIDFWGKETERRTAVYDRVVLAAGSVGTSRLLLKAKRYGTVKGLPDAIGQYWGPNGNVMLARRMWGYPTGMHQSTIPVLGVSNWDDSERSVFAEIAPFPTGIELHTGVYLAITNNPNTGKFTWDDQRRNVHLDWGPSHAKPGVDAVRAFFDPINRAHSGTAYRADVFERRQQFADYFTYHPLGGAVLGEATDLSGEVKGVPGLFVMDGSLIPAKIGVNPFVTITALAERNMDRLLAGHRF